MGEDGKYFDKQDMYDILEGSLLLGCGGGGDRGFSKFLLEQCILTMASYVEYIEPKDIELEYSAVFGLMGFPKQSHEMLLQSYNFIDCLKNGINNAYEAMKEAVGTSEVCPISIETGSFSILTSILLSLCCGVPLVDGDYAGRSYPMLNMSTIAAAGVDPSPLVISSACSDLQIRVSNDGNVEDIESLCRNIICNNAFIVSAGPNEQAFGGIVSLFPAQTDTLGDTIIANTITNCRDIGRTLRENSTDPVEAIINKYNGYKIFQGRITKIEQGIISGYCRGIVTIENDVDTVYVEFLNENFLVWVKNKGVIAMAPDLICYIDQSGKPFSNNDIKVNQDINIIGFKANPKLLESSVLKRYENAIEKYFGYFGGYTPIDKLFQI